MDRWAMLGRLAVGFFKLLGGLEHGFYFSQ
jgi:hypothetical protein